MKGIIEQVDADPHEFMKLKFFGKSKVQRLRDVFNQKFIQPIEDPIVPCVAPPK